MKVEKKCPTCSGRFDIEAVRCRLCEGSGTIAIDHGFSSCHKCLGLGYCLVIQGKHDQTQEEEISLLKKRLKILIEREKEIKEDGEDPYENKKVEIKDYF